MNVGSIEWLEANGFHEMAKRKRKKLSEKEPRLSKWRTTSDGQNYGTEDAD